jgi:hypothetical protein
MPTRNSLREERYGGVTPFYPQPRYIAQNLAPEYTVTNVQLEALAAANQEALRNGLMSPNLASKMLPTLLTEGRSGITRWDYPDTQKYRNILTKAGLPPTIQEIEKTQGNAIYHGSTFDSTLIDSKLMHAVMAAKAANYGEDNAIEKWNGVGADAANHARKVTELERLLVHPKNKPMVDQWQAYQARYADEQPQQAKEFSPPQSWADQNLPAFVSPAVNALSGTVDASRNALHQAQDAIRNWTAQ